MVHTWLSHVDPLVSTFERITILIHKKDPTDDPGNFRPITLESVPLKIFTSAMRNRTYEFLLKNEYVESSVDILSNIIYHPRRNEIF